MVGVQGSSDPNRELLDAAALVGHLVPADSVYAFLAEHRGRLFPDEMFADMFPSSRGRPSQPADLGATVLVLQSLEGLSDRDAIQALRTDLRWKVAAGLALDDEGFHPTVLTYWRTRLRASDRPERIFDAVRAVITDPPRVTCAVCGQETSVAETHTCLADAPNVALAEPGDTDRAIVERVARALRSVIEEGEEIPDGPRTHR